LLIVPAVLGLLAGTGSGSTAGEKAGAPAAPAIVLVGPFTLAEACDKGSRFITEYAREDGPTEAEIREALAACKLSVLDKRVRGPKGWCFALDDKCPKVVAEGPFRFELKDKKGRAFVVQLIRASFVPARTDNSTSPPTRTGYIQLALRVEDTWGKLRETSTYYAAPAVGYDVDGATAGLKKRAQD
jgi:hypothetical protein